MQLQMDKLREGQVATVAAVRTLSVVQTQVGLQVAGGGETLLADLQTMGKMEAVIANN